MAPRQWPRRREGTANAGPRAYRINNDKPLIGMCRSFSVDNAVDCRTFIVKLPVSASRLLRELVPASAWIRDPGLRCHVFCVDKSGALLKTHGLSFQHQGDRRSSPSDLMSQ